MSNGMNALRQYGHIKTGRRISRPNAIYATIAERCDLHCKYCYSWKTTGENERWVSDDAEDLRHRIAKCTKPCTVTCLLDGGMTDTVKTFVKLVMPNDHSTKE